MPWDQGYFEVNANHLYSTDFAMSPSFPRFTDDGSCDYGVDPLLRAFTDVGQATYIKNPFVVDYHFGDLSYSGPTFISGSASVPTTPGFTLPIMGIALTITVAFTRFRQWTRVYRCIATPQGWCR